MSRVSQSDETIMDVVSCDVTFGAGTRLKPSQVLLRRSAPATSKRQIRTLPSQKLAGVSLTHKKPTARQNLPSRRALAYGTAWTRNTKGMIPAPVNSKRVRVTLRRLSLAKSAFFLGTIKPEVAKRTSSAWPCGPDRGALCLGAEAGLPPLQKPPLLQASPLGNWTPSW